MIEIDKITIDGEEAEFSWYAKKEELQKVSQQIANLGYGSISDYWQIHLEEKNTRIKALQDAGGKDSFSYIVITDIHYATNLGKLSPLLAKKIKDDCNIEYIILLGDFQNRSAQVFTREQVLNEWDDIWAMLFPIKDNVLLQKGNHDGSYGTNNAFNLTPEEMYSRIYRKVGMNKNVHFDESGTGYYLADNTNKALFILLNCHCNKFELNEDGTAKYGNLDTFRFTQSQYDLVIEALQNVPTDDWLVILASHVPLDRTGEYEAWGGTVDSNGAQIGNPADCVVMQRMLNAYQNKTTYAETFGGSGSSSTTTANHTNLVDMDSADFKDGYFWDKDNGADHTLYANTDYFVSNYIPITFNKTTPNVLRILAKSINGLRIEMFDSSKSPLGNVIAADNSRYSADFLFADDVISWNAGQLESYLSSSTYGTLAYVRFGYPKANIPSKGIVATVNEEISWTTTESGETVDKYDSVEVNVDFTKAKGRILAYHCGHVHKDIAWGKDYGWNGAEHSDFYIISTRCDAREENESALINERVAGTITEQSFDVFTVNKVKGKLYATKIGAGDDREITY